jgi:hypothetical protein
LPANWPCGKSSPASWINDRYKDLTDMEMAFRTSKTAHLERLPIYVRTEDHTRGHVLVVMLAYLIRREVSRAWRGLKRAGELTTLCSMEVKVEARQLPAHSGSARWIQHLAPSSLGAHTGGAAPLGDSCSRAPVAALTQKSTWATDGLSHGSARLEE